MYERKKLLEEKMLPQAEPRSLQHWCHHSRSTLVAVFYQGLRQRLGLSLHQIRETSEVRDADPGGATESVDCLGRQSVEAVTRAREWRSR